MLGKLWGEFKAFAFQGNMIELAVAVVIGGAFGGVVHSLVGDVIMPTVAYLIHEGETVAEKTKEVAETAASKVGVGTTQPTTAPTTQATTSGGAVPATASAPVVPVTTPAAARNDVLEQVATGKMTVDKGNEILGALPAVTPPAPPAVTPAPAKPDDTKPIAIDFSIGPVPVGKFVTELINFIILAFAVFIMIVKLLGGVMKKMKGPDKPGEPTTRECPECLSIIPIKAKRCSHCTAVVPPVGTVTA